MTLRHADFIAYTALPATVAADFVTVKRCRVLHPTTVPAVLAVGVCARHATNLRSTAGSTVSSPSFAHAARIHHSTTPR